MGISSQEERTAFFPLFQANQAGITRDHYQHTIVEALALRRTALDAALGQLNTPARLAVITQAAMLLVATLSTGHKVLVAGNGGSAAEAQHFASELVGRFKRERMPYAALSLTTDTSTLTAVANDYGYQDVFARQVQAFGQPGDLLVSFSTSGESENLLLAANAAHHCLMTVIAITGDRHSRLEKLADLTIRVPVVETETAQELHMMLTHILCDITETELSARESEGRP
jgi:D-sedoheptulose 7-phosphate isomerase